MRRLRVSLLRSSLLAAFVLVAFACGDDDSAPGTTPPKDGGTDDVLRESGGDAIVPDEDAGTFSVVDVADTPCTPRAGSERVLYAAAENTGISSLATLGTRRVAQRFDGFVLMDADGQNASPSAIAESRAVTVLGPDTLVSVGSNGQGPVVSFHSATGATTVPARLADVMPTLGVAVGGGDGTGLVVFGTQAGVKARGFDTSTFIGPFFFLSSAEEVQNFAASIARKADGSFGIAFSGETIGTAENRRLAFVRATTTGNIPVGFNLEFGKVPRRVTQLIGRPKGGWALLFSYGNELVAHLALLTEEGRLEGPIRRFTGTSSALALAMSGDELGVLALHPGASSPADAGADAEADAGDAGAPGDAAPPIASDLRVAFRPLGLDGNPLAGWVCLGGGVPTTTIAGAMMAEDNGYAAAYSRANGEVVFARFDRRGN